MWYLFSLSFIFGAGIPFARLISGKDFAKVYLRLENENDHPTTNDKGMLSILLNSQSNFFVALLEGLLRGDN